MTIKYIPFAPSNYDGLQTSNDDDFYVKGLYDKDTVTFILYKNTAEINRVNKENYLTNIGEIEGVFRDATSITDLVVTIEYDKFIDFNYIHIPILNRYYFVTDVKIINNKLYELDLSVDVLMSYNTALRNLNAFVDRNEFDYNSDIIDKKIVIEQGVDVEEHIIENTVFSDSLIFAINGYKLSTN